MGFFNWLSRLFKKNLRANIMIIGLENAGKTTLLKRLKRIEHIPSQAVPTVGFATDTFTCGKLFFSCYDMSGQEKYRHLWDECYKEVEAVIFVIDSDDRNKVPAVRNELSLFLDHPDIINKDVPILFFANKMDIQSSMSSVEVSAALQLHEIESKSWNIASSDAISGEGIGEGIEWLCDMLLKKKR